jgi:hypothetical protein
MKLQIDILGWIGSVLLITAYALNSYQKIKPDSYTFLLLNIVAGIFMIIYSWYYMAFANTLINVVWVIIAVPALINVFRKSKTL